MSLDGPSCIVSMDCETKVTAVLIFFCGLAWNLSLFLIFSVLVVEMLNKCVQIIGKTMMLCLKLCW